MQDSETLSLKALCIKQLQVMKAKTPSRTEDGTLDIKKETGETLINEGIRQLSSIKEKPTLCDKEQHEKETIFAKSDSRLKGVPEGETILFPCRRHIPDLKGYGVPSDTLPKTLQIFGYWGYKLVIENGIPVICASVPNPDIDDHCVEWLNNWDRDGCIEAALEWEAKAKQAAGQQMELELTQLNL